MLSRTLASSWFIDVTQARHRGMTIAHTSSDDPATIVPPTSTTIVEHRFYTPLLHTASWLFHRVSHRIGT